MRISPVNSNSYKPSFKFKIEKDKNVAILGSSKSSDALLPDIVKVSKITREIVTSGKNIVTGCGTKGIMGQAYYTAAGYSETDKFGIPTQNYVILKSPLWGDEDIKNCRIISTQTTEGRRIESFIESANKFVIFPGGPGTIQEASTLIANNYYNKEDKKDIILVNKEYFKPLDEQYKKMYDMGLLKVEPEKLYTITDDIDKVMDIINQ